MKFSIVIQFLAATSALACAIPEYLGQEVIMNPDEDALTVTDPVLAAHNAARARYGARPLTENNSLYAATLEYARQCKFVHSHGEGRYGENLYAGSGQNTGVADAVKSWMAEEAKYDYNHPGFSPGTGHFTQVVWKSTTQVSCAIAECRAGTIFPTLASKYVVCRYTPPGNVEGRYAQNVGRPV